LERKGCQRRRTAVGSKSWVLASASREEKERRRRGEITCALHMGLSDEWVGEGVLGMDSEVQAWTGVLERKKREEEAWRVMGWLTKQKQRKGGERERELGKKKTERLRLTPRLLGREKLSSSLGMGRYFFSCFFSLLLFDPTPSLLSILFMLSNFSSTPIK